MILLRHKLSTIIAIIGILLFYSCNNRTGNNKTSDGFRIDSVTSDVVIYDSMLVAPISLTITDKAIVMADFNTADTLISVYTFDGEPGSRFMPKGNGPKEALWIPNIQYNSGDNSLYAPDLNKQSIFHITEYTSDNPVVETAMSCISESESDSIILQGQIVRMANGGYVAANTTVGGMIAEFDSNGNPIATHIPFPDKNLIDEKLTDLANIHLYYPYLRVSPNGKFAALMFDTSDMKIFLTVDSGDITHNLVTGALPNDIYVAQSDPNFVQGFVTKKTKIYTQNLTVSDRYAYQLYIGMTKDEISQTDFFKDTRRNGSQTVKVYDREGNLVRIIILDRWVKSIAISPDDCYLYGLTESSEDGYSVLRYAL